MEALRKQLNDLAARITQLESQEDWHFKVSVSLPAGLYLALIDKLPRVSHIMSTIVATIADFLQKSYDEVGGKEAEALETIDILLDYIKKYYDFYMSLIEDLADISIIVLEGVSGAKLPDSHKNQFKELVAKIKDPYKQFVASTSLTYWISQLIIASRVAGIPFDKVAARIVNKLGKDLAKELKIEGIIAEHYGIAKVEEWRKLIA